ncbi:MAG: hypothetical protein ACE5E9_09440 [Nitrospinaceae bacterium]
MNAVNKLPEHLFEEDGKINLYYLHESFKGIARVAADRLQAEQQIDIPITAGMWGGSYLIADETGKARTNVVRLYSIVNLPQGSPLDDPDKFEKLIKIYHQTFRHTFFQYGLDLVDPRWGEPIPYTNKIRPTTTLQMWDSSKRVKFVRAFFVWNTAPWEESIVYDMVRNIKQIKELLDLNKRPARKTSEELKFLLQDVLIIYFTLRPAMTPDFLQHAQPVIDELLNHFLKGMRDDELIEEQFYKVYSSALVYGYEEALEGPYKEDDLDIHRIEEWPVEKINWVPQKLKERLGPYLRETFQTFRNNLEQKKQKSPPISP